jgi:uncharacterized protein (TIGR03000 family)
VTTYGYGYPIPVESSIPRLEKKDTKKPEEIKPKPMTLNGQPGKAKVVVRLPADAKLYANGELTALTSAERIFSTPALESGVDYKYTMKVEYARDGKAVSESRLVNVRARETSLVEFADNAIRTVSLK